MFTEQQNPKTGQIDGMSAAEIVALINAEDHTVADVVQAALPQIAQAVEAIVAAFGRGGRLIYMGAGTSGRLGVLDAVELLPTYSIPPEQVIGLMAGGHGAMMRSVEGAEDSRALGESDLHAVNLSAHDIVVGIAASGHTPYVLGGLEYAKSIGAFTVGIACNTPAPLLDIADIAIPLPVGPEVVTGSTRMKAGTAQKMALNLISTASMIRIGKTYGNLMVDVRVTNDKLARRAARIVQQLGGVSEAEAADLLQAAGGSAKIAIVMARRGVDEETARNWLDAAGGFLRRVIDEND